MYLCIPLGDGSLHSLLFEISILELDVWRVREQHTLPQAVRAFSHVVTVKERTSPLREIE